MKSLLRVISLIYLGMAAVDLFFWPNEVAFYGHMSLFWTCYVGGTLLHAIERSQK